MTGELEQLKLLAEIDDLVGKLSKWSAQVSLWEPHDRCGALIHRLLERVETLKFRIESPLVVAAFGGTGTGKSSLVNALVGRECTPAGRERPTTCQPILLVHPQTDPNALGLPLEDFRVLKIDSPALRDMAIIDCPDPDTTEAETAASNLGRLHQLLPFCDVLIYTTTQQKYRSARVGEELHQAATGCRLVFVQTHADTDDDVRDDWWKQLAECYEVPEMFYIDSPRALTEQLSGKRPSGDFPRLQDFLTTQLGASQRVQIRRANLLDLIDAVLEDARGQLSEEWPHVEELVSALSEQQQQLVASMTERLGGELLVSRNLWERRLVGSVTQLWGFSPFSSMLRFYNGIGSLIASLSLYRARNSAQMALVGAFQGAKWLKSRGEERDAKSQIERISAFGLDDDLLRESQFVIAGYVRTAKLDGELVDANSLNDLREQAVHVEDQFLGDAGRRIDEMIESLSVRNSRFLTRTRYELLFAAYFVFVLFRVGKNFFYDTFLRDILSDALPVKVEMLSVDFYVSAGIFFVLWSGLLVMAFTRRLRRGLKKKIEQLAAELAEQRFASGLFPKLEQTCREIEAQKNRLEAMALQTGELRNRVAGTSGLGSMTVRLSRPVPVSEES